jgi:outer membrane protein assembly complex protein YaeT
MMPALLLLLIGAMTCSAQLPGQRPGQVPSGGPQAKSPFASLAQPQPMGAQAPAKVIVSDVIIQGNRNLSTEFIRNRMRTRVGKEFNANVLQEDVRDLYATKQFGNVYADKEEDGPNRVKVILFIRDYPNVVEKITYQGAVMLLEKDLDELTGLRKGMPCNPMANKIACRRIVQRYNEDGRPFASCDLIKGGEPGDTEVIFNIAEGPKVRVSGVDFQGNRFVSKQVLKTHLQTSGDLLGLPIGSTLNSAMIEHDMNELLTYYRRFGYQDVQVGRELQYSGDGREVMVVFHIQEGRRYVVRSAPQIEGVKSIPREALESMTKLKPDQHYDQTTIDGDLSRIKDWVGSQGREVAVRSVPVFSKDEPGIVTVRYEVEERPPARVGNITVIGNERTRMNVILRQLGIYPGQLLSYPALRQAERNLARLGIFETSPDGSVRPTVTVVDNPDYPDSQFKDILVNVAETSTGSLMFGLGVNSDAGLTGSIILNERNFDLFRLPTSTDDFLNGTAFRGAGQEFRIEAVPGTQLQRYVISLREPFLFDSPYSLTTSGYFYQRFFNEYAEERLGGRFTLGRKVSDYWSILGSIRLENVQVDNVSAYAPVDYQEVKGNSFLAGFRLGANRDSRDNLLRPTEGSLIDVSVEQVTGDRNFSLANAEYTQYWTVLQRADGSGKQTLSYHSSLGWASSNTPVFERYFAGGFRSLRGFQFRGVGPDVNGFKVGGDFMFLNSLEYQVPVLANEALSLVGFVDSGTVSPRIDKWDEYRVAAGFGLRLQVPMLGPAPIALDFGFPIVKGKFDNTQVFAIFMGLGR